MATEYLEDLLVDKSREVLLGCALGNGAIVAADINHTAYPNTAENYYFSWIRDAGYQLIASHMFGISQAADIRRRHLNWLENECMEYQATGVPVKRSNPNGTPDRRYGTDYQPDQAGIYLLALDKTAHDPDKQTDRIMRRLANGLTSEWSGDSFGREIQDLWENTSTDPERRETFTYTLAVCVRGLSAAIDRMAHQGFDYERSDWLEVRNQMLDMLLADGAGLFLQKISTAPDSENRLDASVLGLVYPFEPVPGSLFEKKTSATVQALEQKLYLAPDGMQRYEGDTYDGIVRLDGSEKTAGRWPLLTFWLAIAKHRMGERQQAQEIFRQQVQCLSNLYEDRSLPSGYIPEQIYPDSERQGKGIIPLGWSHAKFLIALTELNP